MNEHSHCNRRSFVTACTATATCAAGSWNVARAAQHSLAAAPPRGPREALQLLKAGNDRFRAGKSKCAPVSPEALAELEKEQHPFATILGCSDSRVPIEMIFDQGLGDLFVVRLAGNVVDTDVVGSLEYAVAHLQTKLIVVLGHEGCGAVTAALAAKEEREKEPQGIQKLVQQIEPALAGIDPALPQAEKLRLAIEANVRHSVAKILAFPGHAAARQKGLYDIVGAVYELRTGKARLVEP